MSNITIPSDESASTPTSRRVRSAQRVAAVLDALRDAHEPLRHAEVARITGIAKSSTSNLLDTLVDVGLVARDTRGYGLGTKLIALGAAAAERLEIRTIALPVLRELSDLGIGTANLAILHGNDVLYVEKVNNPAHVIQIATRVGGTAPAHATALGKVLVAALDPVARETWIRDHAFTAVTEHTMTSASAFAEAVAVAARRGYALDEEEQNLRTVCVAAPLTDHTGATVAAISLSCLGVDLPADRAPQIAAVTDGARRISAMLGAAARLPQPSSYD